MVALDDDGLVERRAGCGQLAAGVAMAVAVAVAAAGDAGMVGGGAHERERLGALVWRRRAAVCRAVGAGTVTGVRGGVGGDGVVGAGGGRA